MANKYTEIDDILVELNTIGETLEMWSRHTSEGGEMGVNELDNLIDALHCVESIAREIKDNKE